MKLENTIEGMSLEPYVVDGESQLYHIDENLNLYINIEDNHFHDIDNIEKSSGGLDVVMISDDGDCFVKRKFNVVQPQMPTLGKTKEWIDETFDHLFWSFVFDDQVPDRNIFDWMPVGWVIPNTCGNWKWSKKLNDFSEFLVAVNVNRNSSNYGSYCLARNGDEFGTYQVVLLHSKEEHEICDEVNFIAMNERWVSQYW
jgi:hypothetical protein